MRRKHLGNGVPWEGLLGSGHTTPPPQHTRGQKHLQTHTHTHNRTYTHTQTHF